MLKKRFSLFWVLPGVLFLSLLLQSSLLAQGTIVLKADRWLDVRAGTVKNDALIVIEGDKIAAIGGTAPAGAEVIDLGDVTLLPGLIDSHTHLSMQLSAQSFIQPVKLTEADYAMEAVFNARRTIDIGFTTVRDFGSGIDVALSKAVAAGKVVGPRVVPSRYLLGITGGHCDVTGFAPGILERSWREGIADGVDEVVKAVRYQIKHGAKVIKTCATAGVLSFEETVGAQQYSYEELKAMVDEAARHSVKVAAHAHGTEGIKAAVRAGVASIEHGSILDDEAIAMMKERGTYLVPTTYLSEVIDLDALPPLIRQKAETVLPMAQRSLEKAIRAGVKIAFGTDAAVFPHGQNAREFLSLVKRGMSPLEAIRAATINAADLLDVKDRGSLEVGLLADIVAVPGNPVQDISKMLEVGFVMQGGKIIRYDQ